MRIKSYAKVNIFLKIVGIRGNYHEIASRFMVVRDLFDTVSFEKSENGFDIEGNFSCPLEQNSVYKAYVLLSKESDKVADFFKSHKVVIDKKIPEFAGLGGGSSNAAYFLILANEVLDLKLSKEKLSKIGEKIGADVSFFIYEYESANVFGIGEIVEKFEEESLKLDIITPRIKCDTKKVYQTFRKNLKENMLEENRKLTDKLKNMKSKDILENFSSKELNDLFLPAKTLCKELKEYEDKNLFFSGSGSSFFRVRNG